VWGKGGEELSFAIENDWKNCSQDKEWVMLSNAWDWLRPLYAVEALQGYTEDEIKLLKGVFGALPPVLEEYYRIAGRTEELHQVQDIWMQPEYFQAWGWLRQSEYLVLLNENQGVCRAGIRKEDLCLPDPPVYYTEDDKNWILCAPTTSEFLSAALAYEAAFHFVYSPEEFYWITGAELDFIKLNLTKLPFELKNWVGGMGVLLFQNEADNMVAVMDCGDGDSNMLYGGATEASYDKLRKVLEGIGEPM
jgi:hypothetical protein